MRVPTLAQQHSPLWLPSVFAVAELVCALSFDPGNEVGVYPILLNEIHTWVCGSILEAAAERSAVAARVFADARHPWARWRRIATVSSVRSSEGPRRCGSDQSMS